MSFAHLHQSLAPGADESAASSAPSSPEPPLDDDGDFFPLQSNDSRSSFGVASSRSSSMGPRPQQQLPKAPIEQLPAELMIGIFQKLSSTTDLYNCLRVSKSWASNCVDLLWHRPLFTSWERLTIVAHAIQSTRAYWLYHNLIKRLNLSTLNTDINDGTMQPFNICKRIERLTLTSCERLTDQGIMSLVQGNAHLLALDITGILSVTDSSIRALAQNCPRLQGLNITGCTNVTDTSLVPLAKSCKYLKRLKLNKCINVTDNSIEAFASRCPSMLEIDLQGCEFVTDSSVTSLLQGCKQLRELRLASCHRVTNGAFVSLPPNIKLESLRILDLTACVEVTDVAVERIIDSAPRLRILVLAKCIHITDKSVYAISKLGKNLHDIHLGRCTHITDEALKDLISKCNRIRYIDLAGCSHVTDASVKMLANLPKLRRIGLVKCHNITDASIRALARGTGHPVSARDPRSQVSSSLERVHLSYCLNITIRGINELLKKCPKLTHLSLTGIQAFFGRDDLVAYCREAPAEFNDEQRVVFCVFSGDGVSKLREHLAADPLANPAEYPLRDDEEDDADDEDGMYTIPTDQGTQAAFQGHGLTMHTQALQPGHVNQGPHHPPPGHLVLGSNAPLHGYAAPIPAPQITYAGVLAGQPGPSRTTDDSPTPPGAGDTQGTMHSEDVNDDWQDEALT